MKVGENTNLLNKKKMQITYVDIHPLKKVNTNSFLSFFPFDKFYPKTKV